MTQMDLSVFQREYHKEFNESGLAKLVKIPKYEFVSGCPGGREIIVSIDFSSLKKYKNIFKLYLERTTSTLILEGFFENKMMGLYYKSLGLSDSCFFKFNGLNIAFFIDRKDKGLFLNNLSKIKTSVPLEARNYTLEILEKNKGTVIPRADLSTFVFYEWFSCFFAEDFGKCPKKIDDEFIRRKLGPHKISQLICGIEYAISQFHQDVSKRFHEIENLEYLRAYYLIKNKIED